MEVAEVFTEEQISFMKKLGIRANFNAPSDDEAVLIEDRVASCLQEHGFDKDYMPTAIGTMCESILDTFAEMP